MAVQSRSGWQAAIGAVSDTIDSFRRLPQTYFALFILGALPTFGTLGRDRLAEIHDPSFSDAELWDAGIGLLTLVLIIPLAIGLLRYFSGASPVYPSGLLGLTLRFIGWAILLTVLFIIAAIAVFGLAALISVFAGGSQMPEILALIIVVIGMVVMAWLALRFVTFYPILANGQPSPIWNAFRETSGWAWYILRASLIAALIWMVLAFAALVLQALLLGAPFTDLETFVAASAQKQELGMRLILSVLAGALMTFFLGFQSAFLGRIFRNIRGIA